MSVNKIPTPKFIFVADQCPKNQVHSAGHCGVIELTVKRMTTFGDHFIS